MSNNTSSDLKLQCIAENDPHVKRVDVDSDNCSRVAAALLGNTHIEKLVVHIGAARHRDELPVPAYDPWNEFCRAVQELPSVKTVWVYMLRREPSEEDLILLGILLEHTNQINTLWLSGCLNSSILRSPAVCRLARNLTEIAGLEEFSFDYFQILPTDLAPLLLALSSLPRLNYIYLDPHFQCTPMLLPTMLDEDAFSFLKRLLRKQSLVKFCYDNVAFSDAQADAILDIMSRNFDIDDLGFYQHSETPNEAMTNLQKKIDAITKLNKAGRRYLAERGPECKAAGINVLSAVSDDLDCLYYHLRENPLLVVCDPLVGKSPKNKRKR